MKQSPHQFMDIEPLSEMRPWREFRWWLISASVFTIIAAICVASLKHLFPWGYVLVVLCSLPFVAEAWIQFRSWWRRILWITAGIIIGISILNVFPALFLSIRGYSPGWPAWIRGPLTFLFPAALEFIASSRQRNRPWVWLFVTPALFGLAGYWMGPALYVAEKTRSFVAAESPFSSGSVSNFYFSAAAFGSILFTRALTGAFIASRKVFQA